ncbi:MAG: DUF4157 domain-containing protein, partial [Clostridia bacterium]|nr:DUF4157 domain-containing protein [Clostridia bacterium]
MTHSYEQRKPAQRQEAPKRRPTDPAQGSVTAFGAAPSSFGASGSPVDLPGAIREKFENAFGTDLSAVRLYRSQAVADAGAQAVTMGEKVAFAPGMLDFSSRSGQTLLGHELSHVVSQQRGEVTGSGFLNDPALEARADREGAMAAAGQQIAMPTAAISSATAASASGPMQAKKDTKRLGLEYEQVNPMEQDSQLDSSNDLGTRNVNRGVGDAAVTANPSTKTLKTAADYFKLAHAGVGSAVKFTDTHYARTDPSMLKRGNWGEIGSPVGSILSGILGTISGGLTAYTSGASAIRGLRNLKAGASKADVAEDASTALGGVGTAASGVLSTIKTIDPLSKFGTMMQAGGGLQDLIPGLSIATGGITAGVGLSQMARGGKRWHDIDQQIKSVAKPYIIEEDLSDDQKKMLRTMRHGKEVQKRNTLVGASKLVGGGLSAAGGAVSLGGVTAPLGLGLSAAGALASGIGSIYGLWKNRRLRKNAIAEELGGMSYSDAIADVRK